jgi:hypothetical protein
MGEHCAHITRAMIEFSGSIAEVQAEKSVDRVVVAWGANISSKSGSTATTSPALKR